MKLNERDEYLAFVCLDSTNSFVIKGKFFPYYLEEDQDSHIEFYFSKNCR